MRSFQSLDADIRGKVASAGSPFCAGPAAQGAGARHVAAGMNIYSSITHIFTILSLHYAAALTIIEAY